MPYFRAQMNCVPGMVTEFAFEPIYTTAEYRELPYMVKKANNKMCIQKKYWSCGAGGCIRSLQF
jgi:cytochrome c oxidase subunit 2